MGLVSPLAVGEHVKCKLPIVGTFTRANIFASFMLAYPFDCIKYISSLSSAHNTAGDRHPSHEWWYQLRLHSHDLSLLKCTGLEFNLGLSRCHYQRGAQVSEFSQDKETPNLP